MSRSRCMASRPTMTRTCRSSSGAAGSAAASMQAGRTRATSHRRSRRCSASRRCRWWMGAPEPTPWRPGTSRGPEAFGESDSTDRGAPGVRPHRRSREEARRGARIQSRRQYQDHQRHLRQHRARSVAHAPARAHRESWHASGRRGFARRGGRPAGHRHEHENPRVAGRCEQHDDAAGSGAQEGSRAAARKRRRQKRETAIVAISCRALTKRFGDVVAVAGLDLTVGAGECFGLLGPNGAGKTPTIEILEGLTVPDSGDVAILGTPWREGAAGRALRERLGIQLQETQLADKLTVTETLTLFRSFYRQAHTVDEVLALVELEEKRRARVVTLSGGQKQRLAVACALVSKPELLFLDEPTTGLDPQSRRQLWDVVQGFKAHGRTVLLTTHYMDEAERLCDRVAVVDRGKVIALGTPAELVASIGGQQVIEVAFENGVALDDSDLGRLPGVHRVGRAGGGLSLAVDRLHETLPALLALAQERRAQPSRLATHHATLEDVFVTLPGRQLRECLRIRSGSSR